MIMLSAKQARELGANTQAQQAFLMQQRIKDGYLQKEMEVILATIQKHASDHRVYITVVDFLPEYAQDKGAIKLQSIVSALHELGYETDLSCSTNPENENMKVTW